jgi:hypothetical protein
MRVRRVFAFPFCIYEVTSPSQAYFWPHFLAGRRGSRVEDDTFVARAVLDRRNLNGRGRTELLSSDTRQGSP